LVPQKRREHIFRPFASGVCLLKQKLRLVGSAGFYADEMNPNAEFLRLLNTDPDILVTRYQYSVSHRSIPSESDHVGHQQGVYPFLLSDSIHKTKTEFETRFEGEGQMLWRRTR
jgi:hypothetical protein